MPIYETGHARNVQHFQEMISFVDSWGGAYAPTNTAISLANLNVKNNDSVNAVGAVTAANATYKAAVAARENTFSGLRRLITRVVNFYQSTGAPENSIENAQSLKRKIDGTRAEIVVDDPSTPEDETENSVSAAQLSYTQLVQHLDALINVLSSDPLYAPAETDIKLTTLTTLRSNMETANTAVMTAAVPLSNTRGDRDAALYADGTGLVDLAGLVKKYTKAAFGTNSLQYSQIKGLPFNRPNK